MWHAQSVTATARLLISLASKLYAYALPLRAWMGLAYASCLHVLGHNPPLKAIAECCGATMH